jgi:hypothetical protein
MSSSPGDLATALLWPLQPGAFPGARRGTTLHALRALLRTPPSSARRTPCNRAWMLTITIARSCSRADAATSAVLAALPSGAKASLRLSCRAGRKAVDAHARRLEVKLRRSLITPAAAARMPLLQEVELSASNDADALELAAGLRALAEGPARLANATVRAEGGGSALAGLVSALSGLTALTRLELDVECLPEFDEDAHGGGWPAPPLVLPWAHIEVGAAGACR